MPTRAFPMPPRISASTRVLTLCAAIAAISSPSRADPPAVAPLPTIQWDRSTLRLIEQGGDYGRMARLPDGAVACAYDRGSKMYLRLSTDGGSTFPAPPILVAS